MVSIDLTDVNLFDENHIDFDKKSVFIYGRNGTGKSTLTKIIEDQLCIKYDVSVFQGFDNLIDEEEKLNAVLLGEENVKINQKIKFLEKDIKEINEKADVIKKQIEAPSDGSTNCFSRKETAERNLFNQNKKIDEFYFNSAKYIREKLAHVTTSYNYNRNHFKQEIEMAEILDDKDFTYFNKLIHSEIKIAKKIYFPELNFEELKAEVDNLLDRIVKAAIAVPRIDGNEKKTEFARMGLEIHKKGEYCAFCGNVINDDVFDELNLFFTADDIEGFQGEISKIITKLEKIKENIQDLQINRDEFYPDYAEKIDEIYIDLSAWQHECNAWLDKAIELLNEKRVNVFRRMENLAMDTPESLKSIADRYNIIIKKNNNKELIKEQKEAKDKLRYHYVKKCMIEFDYDIKKREIDLLTRELENKQKEYDEQKEEYTKLKIKVEKIRSQIRALEAETISEEILAININKKLRNMVPFALIYQENEYKGYYQIKDTTTGEIRDVTQLSTGEKNIIAFLYFIEKLNEIKDKNKEKPRIIVFDDPMNSNDDTMQYLIVEELQAIHGKIQCEHFVIMTHNNHFYINVRYGFSLNKANFYRFQNSGNKTFIKKIQKQQDDFKTSYEELWQEMRYLFEKLPDDKASMLLNPIRRIIETYTKFNNIDEKIFYRSVIGVKKLFNVNSHSIDDLEAELNGRNKKDIIQLVYDCFYNNSAASHFKHHWDNLNIDENGRITWDDVTYDQNS